MGWADVHASLADVYLLQSAKSCRRNILFFLQPDKILRPSHLIIVDSLSLRHAVFCDDVVASAHGDECQVSG